MPDPCLASDPLVTPYVDGELPTTEREVLEAHARVCAPCRARIASEQAVHRLVAARRDVLTEVRAPDALRAKCAALVRNLAAEGDASATAVEAPARSGAGRIFPPASRLPPVPTWRARLYPMALAATLVLLVGAAFLYRLTESSTRVMAAELTADHMKCFMMNTVLGTSHPAAAVESSMATSFGWNAQLPDHPAEIGLELVGSRPCLYGEGRVAHIMYRHNGKPVSVFMLPKKRRPEELLHVMGHEAAIWSDGDRTFVVIAREPRSEVERIAEFVHASLK